MATAGADHAEARATDVPPPYVFTVNQLDAYGIHELRTLEAVPRQNGPSVSEAHEMVCERIRLKIGWPESDTPVDAVRFLEIFYAALKARLENRMLFGHRREDKHDQG